MQAHNEAQHLGIYATLRKMTVCEVEVQHGWWNWQAGPEAGSGFAKHLQRLQHLDKVMQQRHGYLVQCYFPKMYFPLWSSNFIVIISTLPNALGWTVQIGLHICASLFAYCGPYIEFANKSTIIVVPFQMMNESLFALAFLVHFHNFIFIDILTLNQIYKFNIYSDQY